MKKEYIATYGDGEAYIYIEPWKPKKEIRKTVKLPRAEVYIDLDKDNNILGIEVLNIIIDQNKT